MSVPRMTGDAAHVEVVAVEGDVERAHRQLAPSMRAIFAASRWARVTPRVRRPTNVEIVRARRCARGSRGRCG